MTMLYSKEDYSRISSLLRRIWLIAAAILAAGMVIWAVFAAERDRDARMKWPGYAAAGVCAVAVVFIQGMYGSRLSAYRRYLLDVDRGLEREMTGTVADIERIPSVSDGLEFISVRMSDDAGEGKNGDRLVRYDREKSPLPFQPGQRVRLLLFGNNIKGYEILSP